MPKDKQEEKTLHKVVVNQEGRYSIWPADRENARGWRDAGKSGTMEQCTKYIEKISSDTKPPAGKKKTDKIKDK
ncbi:MAG TPA: MbtH family NRPS accessory protein [Pyrinomonadaceae bacterium]|jgi:MbtH protein|nr:MbtH family NRPS accessory protein [Pyrinomonadaceae bacterium]